MNNLSRLSHRGVISALVGAVSLAFGGCATAPQSLATPTLMPSLRAALQSPGDGSAAAAPAAPARPAAAAPSTAALREETQQLPLPFGRAERRFSVVLNNATPEVLFMALLAETPLSVAVDPGVKGPLSISLKDVTLRESLDLLRELHGLEYKVIGRHILVSAAQMQTRIFTVDYPSFNRSGRSELRVLSGSITGSSAAGGGSGGSQGGSPPNSTNNGSGGGGSSAQESSRISTAQRNDLWGEIETTVKLLVGDKEGRSVVVSPQTGNIVVRALPREIRAISDYLEATRVSVQRQVMLEAKVVEVQLRDSERTGINWSAFKLGLSTRASGGVISPGGSLSTTGTIGDGLLTVNPGVALESAATAAGSLLGLAFQTRNFAAVLDFLGSQGNTQVLSSPRIATMNNQKAVLKVGTDDFFVTSISSTTTAVGNSTATTPNIGVQPFFSGISLDVTPNIDAQGFITLHVHPSVSTVSERTKIINLGTQGSYALPLASSEINESDAVVRAYDGNIIAIGGLMRQATSNSDSGVPGTEGTFFRKLLGGQTNKLSEKRELVILLKPTIVDPSVEDAELRRDSLQRLLDWTETQPLRPASTTPRAAAPVAPAPVSLAAPLPAPSPAPSPAPVPVSAAPAAIAVKTQPAPAAVQPASLNFASMGAAFNSNPAPAVVAPVRAAPAKGAQAAGKPADAPAFATLGPISLLLRTPALTAPQHGVPALAPAAASAPAPEAAPAATPKSDKAFKGLKLLTVKYSPSLASGKRGARGQEPPVMARSLAHPWSPAAQRGDSWVQPIGTRPEDLRLGLAATEVPGRSLRGSPRPM